MVSSLFFGTSGDVDYLDELTGRTGLAADTIAERSIPARGETTNDFVRRLTRTWPAFGDAPRHVC